LIKNGKYIRKTKNKFPLMAKQNRTFKMIVIGVSAGGTDALCEIFTTLPASFPLPVATMILLME